MDTAKYEKQVTSAGKTTASIGWLALVVAVILALISFQHVGVAVINLVLLGGLGLWMVVAGKKAQKQADGRNFQNFRRTITLVVWGMGVVCALMLLLGGGPGILLLLVMYWDIRALKAAKQLETGAGAGPTSVAPVPAADVQLQPEQGPGTQK